MTAGNFIVYDSFKLWMGDGTFDMDADTFKILLTSNTYTPALTHSVLADITNEVASGNGYTTGGATLATIAWTKSGSTTTFDATVDPSWTASGGSIGPARKAVIYKAGTANAHVSPLVCYCVLDSADITTTDGNTLTIQLNASGILTLTGATS